MASNKQVILIIEDDKVIREELQYVLQCNGFKVELVVDFEHVEEQVRQINPHMILLDINLPNVDGYQLCMNIRKFSDTPIIFVTSRDSEMDELKSLTLGGDDYITKPYNISVLLMRINKILGRVYKENESVSLLHKGVELNTESSQLYFQGESVTLTRNELYIMRYLFRNAGKISMRTDIIDYLWDNEVFIDDNALSVNITRIRQKLSQLGLENFIETKHRQGYYI